jgi:hypothetical protein
VFDSGSRRHRHLDISFCTTPAIMTALNGPEVPNANNAGPFATHCKCLKDAICTVPCRDWRRDLGHMVTRNISTSNRHSVNPETCSTEPLVSTNVHPIFKFCRNPHVECTRPLYYFPPFRSFCLSSSKVSWLFVRPRGSVGAVLGCVGTNRGSRIDEEEVCGPRSKSSSPLGSGTSGKGSSIPIIVPEAESVVVPVVAAVEVIPTGTDRPKLASRGLLVSM